MVIILMRRYWAILFYVSFICPAWAGEVNVAVAANFAAPIKKIAAAFEQASGHHVTLSIGSSGILYAQITQAAPFDVFLSADQAMPERLIQEQCAVPLSQFTYAIGRLVLWSADPNLIDQEGTVLSHGHFLHLAVASPKLAPYGKAAYQTLAFLNKLIVLTPKLVQGESVAQTYTFVASGNAELGFVALSQVMKDNQLTVGSAWIVPTQMYTPLRQDAVLLNRGKDNLVALAFLTYLQSAPAKKIMHSYGYSDG